MTSVSGSKARPDSSRVIGFVFVTVFLDLVGFGIIIPLLPFYVQSMGGSARTVGYLFSCFSLTQLIATPFLGRLSDRYGRRPVILLSLFGNAVSMALFALATKLHLLPLLFASRILAGATAGNLSTCQAAIADVTDGAERAKGMGRLGAGIGLGMVSGPAIGSTLAQFGEWAPPLGAAAMALVDLTAAFFFMPETRQTTHRAEAPASWRSLGAILRRRALLVVLSIYFLTFLYMTNMQVVLQLLVNRRFGWGEKQIGYVFAMWGIMLLLVQGVLIGRIAKRFAPLSVVVAGAIFSGAGLATIAVSQSVPVLIAGLSSLGFGLGITQPLLATIASEYAGSQQRGAVLGTAQSAGGLARTIGPSLSGWLFDVVSPGAPFFAGAVAATLALVLAIVLRREERDPVVT